MTLGGVTPRIYFRLVCVETSHNDLLLNADKSEVMLAGSSPQLKAESSINTVSVAGVSLPVSSVIKPLGVVIDSRLTFDTHVKAICRACN